ncbi:MAG TPA: TIGR02253 family HAD-type hydrolase [Planctomycetota bacterium]|nr:TIGR02253 family HAD-type hydrolase [Planctomycetota bacterium]
MTRLKAVLFDIDDTLFPTTEFARRARRNAVRAMVDAGLTLDEELVFRELEEVIAEFSSNYEHHYDKLVRRLRVEALTPRRTAPIVAAGVAAYHDTKMREIAPFEDVPPLLDDLRDAGLRLGVITHGWSVKQAEKLVRLGLIPFFEADAIFISDQIGISKPNPKLYKVALEEMGLEGPEAMYVGDNPEHDIAPPRSLGMVAVWSSRAARHTPQEAGVEPDHEVADFDELRTLLRERFEIPV